MAIAKAQLAVRYNRPGFAVIDRATYVLAAVGALAEASNDDIGDPQ